MEKKKSTAKDKTLFELLKELVQTEEQAILVDIAETKSKSNTLIKGKVKSFRDYMEKQAKLYGQSKQKTESIVKKYEGFLEQATKKYKQERKVIIEEKQDYETQEIESISDYKKTLSKLKGYKETRAYEEVVGYRAEIEELKNEGRKKKAEKKNAEFIEYKKTLEEKIQRVEADLQAIAEEQIVDGNQETKNERAQTIVKIAKRLEKLQERRLCVEYDNKLEELKTNIETCRKTIKAKEKSIRKCDKLFEESAKRYDLEQEEELKRANKQNPFQKLLGIAYTKVSANSINPIENKKVEAEIKDNTSKEVKTIEQEKVKDEVSQTKQTKKEPKRESKTENKLTMKSLITSAKKKKNKIIKALEEFWFDEEPIPAKSNKKERQVTIID